MTPLANFKLPFNRFADEVCPPLIILKGVVNALKRAFREASRGLFVVDLGAPSDHDRRIDDITNYYKPSFCCCVIPNC